MAGSGLEVVSRFCILTLRDRFVDLSVAISVLIRVSLQPLHAAVKNKAYRH